PGVGPWRPCAHITKILRFSQTAAPERQRAAASLAAASCLLGDILEGGPIRYGDRGAFDAHAARALPFAQALVDAFARPPHDIAELALGHLNGRGVAAR